jgi:hypothetical protein
MANIEEKKIKAKEYNQAYYKENRESILEDKKAQRQNKYGDERKKQIEEWIIDFHNREDGFYPFNHNYKPKEEWITTLPPKPYFGNTKD